ncbi:hypothetical protein [Aureimonas sp. AU40]|uniref:hypothetical protein n=1 Tax=Aureimonas sp. AU40 TaxID=1637747 RepID=UPI000784B9B4|nr:hypothetical protein [Aureimonas sp. AU40]
MVSRADLAPHEIHVVLTGRVYHDAEAKTLKDGPVDTFHSVYLDRKMALKACVILKHEDEISGDNFSLYRVADDVTQTELPEQDPGMCPMSDAELEEAIQELL